MDQYNVIIPDSVVYEIADNVIEYLMEYPEDSVDCTIMKVILDKKSRFLPRIYYEYRKRVNVSVYCFNGEEVDYHQFICRMFDVRENLVKLVRKRVEQYGSFSIIDPDKNKFLDRIGTAIVSIISGIRVYPNRWRQLKKGTVH